MSAYLDGSADSYATINADSTAGRRSRAAQINAENAATRRRTTSRSR